MSQRTKVIHKLEDVRDSVHTLRDEIRVRIHLAGMEARDQWTRLDAKTDHFIGHLAQASREAIDELVAELRKFSHSLEQA